MEVKREIYVVNAFVVDANGTMNQYTGYPKSFDSRNYDHDIAKAMKRAKGEWHEVMGAFEKRDDRQLQFANMTELSTGMVLYYGVEGQIAPVVVPDPEPEEPEETPEA